MKFTQVKNNNKQKNALIACNFYLEAVIACKAWKLSDKNKIAGLIEIKLHILTVFIFCRILCNWNNCSP